MANTENIIAVADFDPKVKTYWLVLGLFIGLVTVVGIVLIPLVVIIILLMSQRILDAMSAELFERKLVVKRGVFVKVEKSIPLEKITDVSLTQGPLMRYFGLYKLDFETAGQSGEGALVSLLGVVDAINFRETILAQKDSLAGVKPADAASVDPMIELLKSVRSIEAMLKERDGKALS